MQQVIKRLTDEVGRSPSRDGFERRIERFDTPIACERIENVRGGLDQVAVPGFAAPDRLIRNLPLVDVDHGADHFERLAIVVERDDRAVVEPLVLSIGAKPAIFGCERAFPSNCHVLRDDPVAVFRVNPGAPEASLCDEVAFVESCDVGRGGADVRRLQIVEARGINHHGNGREELFLTGFALAKRIFHHPAPCDVEVRHDRAPRFDRERGDRQVEPPLLGVAVAGILGVEVSRCAGEDLLDPFENRKVGRVGGDGAASDFEIIQPAFRFSE